MCAERGQGLRPIPRTPSPLAARIPPLRTSPDRFILTKPNSWFHNRPASVATLRQPFAIGPECPFAFPSDSAFAFAGIPNQGRGGTADIVNRVRKLVSLCVTRGLEITRKT